MQQPVNFSRYGVIEQTVSNSDVDYACESIIRLGFGIIDGRFRRLLSARNSSTSLRTAA